LSQALQEIELDVISAQNLIESTLKALENLNNVDKFDSIYNLCFDFSKKNEIDLPKLKRQANKPARFREGNSTSVVFSTPVEKYQSLYFQTLNITMEEIKSHFSKDSINPIKEMADILKNASVESTDSLDGRSIYNEMINFSALKSQFKLSRLLILRLVKLKSSLPGVIILNIFAVAQCQIKTQF